MGYLPVNSIDLYGEQMGQSLYYEGRINYASKFGAHDLSVMGVTKFSKRNVIVAEPYKDEVWAGRVTYNYDLRYLFEANLGLSGSEQFGQPWLIDIIPSDKVPYRPGYSQLFNM